MDVHIQQQLAQCTLCELMQILIYLIHEIEYRMTARPEGGAAGSDIEVEYSDSESDDAELWDVRWYYFRMVLNWRCSVGWQ